MESDTENLLESNLNNLLDLITFQNAKYDNKSFLNFREKEQLISFSNKDFLEKICQFACGLKEIGVQKNQTIANISYQNPIWLIADFGSLLSGAVTVPIFYNISTENLFYEIEDAEVGFVFSDNKETAQIIAQKYPKIKIITRNFTLENHIEFESILSLGKQAIKEQKYDLNSMFAAPKANDLATIIYTSGSTGKPKGVKISHNNLISQIKATAQRFPLKENDIALSFLPLAHIFERMVMMFYISQGISIYFCDDIKNIGRNLKEFHPTLMTAVPRVLEKTFIKIKEGIEEGKLIKKIIGRAALKRALTKTPDSKPTILDKIFDKIVYSKFRSGLGGKMEMIICGGAALSEELQIFFNNIGINLFCGYGLTETSPVIAANYPTANKIGTVGHKFPNLEVRIAENGELEVKGDNVMIGYHKLPKKTAETIIDGWLKTGDLAQIDTAGFIKIVGRSKESFKNSNGKYINPVKIEQKLIQELGFLIGSCIIAEGRSFTSALLFPEFELLEKFKKKFNFKGSNQEFLQSEKLAKFAEEKIQKINLNLDHWEQVKKFKIITQEISIESGEITPSMKLKRNVVEEKFGREIENLYND